MNGGREQMRRIMDVWFEISYKLRMRDVEDALGYG